MAVKSKAQLKADILSEFPTNHINQITAEDLRGVTTNMVDSLAIESGTMNWISGEGIPDTTLSSDPYTTNKVTAGKGIHLNSIGSNNAQIALTIPISGSTSYGGTIIEKTRSNGLGFSTLIFGNGLRSNLQGIDGILVESSGGGLGGSGIQVVSGTTIPNNIFTNPADITSLTISKGIEIFSVGDDTHIGLGIPISGSTTFGGAVSEQTRSNGLGFSTLVIGTGLRIETTGTDGIVIHGQVGGGGGIGGSGIYVASGNTVPTTTFTTPSEATTVTFTQGLQPFNDGGDISVGLNIPVSGISLPTGTLAIDGQRITRNDGLGFSFLKFGDGLISTPSDDGSLKVETAVAPGWINVKTDLTKLGFPANAKGDWDTDDTAALQNAFNYAMNSGSVNLDQLSVVFIPPGRYKITNSLVIGGPSSINRGFSILGGSNARTNSLANANIIHRPSSKLIWEQSSGGTVGPLLKIENTDCVAIEGIEFFGHDSITYDEEYTQMGVWVNMSTVGIGVMNHYFTRCSFYNFERAYESRTSMKANANCFFYGCYWQNNKICFTNWHAQGVQNYFHDCQFNIADLAFMFFDGGQLEVINASSVFLHKILHREDGGQNISGFFFRGWKCDDSLKGRRCKFMSDSSAIREPTDLNSVIPTIPNGSTHGRTYGITTFEKVVLSQGQGDVYGTLVEAWPSGSYVALEMNYPGTSTSSYGNYDWIPKDPSSDQAIINWGEKIFVTGSPYYNGTHEITGIAWQNKAMEIDENVTFTAPSTITPSSANPISLGFRPGVRIEITNSSLNDGTYFISTSDTTHFDVRETSITSDTADPATINGRTCRVVTNTPYTLLEVGSTATWYDGDPLIDMQGGANVIVRDSYLDQTGMDHKRFAHMTRSDWAGGRVNNLLVENCLGFESGVGTTGLHDSYIYEPAGDGSWDNHWKFRDMFFWHKNLPPTGESSY